jgi:hypothetical protein
MYPGYAKVAREEGFDEIAEWFDRPLTPFFVIVNKCD